MLIIPIVALAALLIFSVTFRCAVFHPIKVARNAAVDIYYYFKRKKYNFLRTGELVAYCGLFGKGKTLSVVHDVVAKYRRYNNVPVWCPRREKMVTQRVKVISNVELRIPYEHFESLMQLVNATKLNEIYDDENDTLTVTLVIGDEFSVQLNSRLFKNNIDPLFLNALLTCRHYHLAIYYTTQRFQHTDALLRQVTNYVIECDKLWRFQRLKFYDAWDMENATSSSALSPFRRGCWFVTNSDYEAYDTFASVGNLTKSCQEGDMISEAEILALQRNSVDADITSVSRPSKRWLRRQRKR